MTKIKRIGIFGGSFDPVHKGHIQLALLSKKEADLDKVIFIPAYHPPHKKNRKLTSQNHRLKMLKLALKPYPFFKVSHFELNSRKPVYTYQTIRYFKNKFNRASIFFILGSDSLSEIKTWKKPELIASSCAIITGNRPGTVLDSIPYKKSILFLSKVIYDVSSSLIRYNVKKGISIRSLVPKEIERYIKVNGLYNE
ncbi:MAG: nicotinate-nucleotide adenylyltransferase [Elusimicrobia bacterium]|nr:nicotinate-nucleotide adenylyltransferase [Candidatus Liberimonas magnetica]